MSQAVDVDGKTVVTEWEPHFELAESIVRFLKPTVTVDIGTHEGYSAKALAKNNPGHVYTIDRKVWFEEGTFDGHDNITFMKGDSHDIPTLWPDGKAIDILHIDGGHHFDTVLEDVKLWGRFITDKSVILLHDVANISIAGFGPIKAFNTLMGEGLFKAAQAVGNGLGILTYSPEFMEGVIRGRQDIVPIQELNVAWVFKLIELIEPGVENAKQQATTTDTVSGQGDLSS